MAADRLGPWTTSLAEGSQMELSAFWRRRMARLTGLASKRPKRTSNGSLGLALMIVVIGAGPLVMRAAPETPTEGANAQVDTAQSARRPPKPATDEAAAILQRTVSGPTEVNFQETALEDALRYLSEYHHVPIRIDVAALKDGPKLNIPITLDLHGVSLRTMLSLLLEPLRLDWYIENHELVITKTENVDQRLEHWIFDIQSIRNAGIGDRDLANTISAVVDATSWRPTGAGELSIAGADLRVLQSPSTRMKIEVLLDEIDLRLRESSESGKKMHPRLVTRTYVIDDLLTRRDADDPSVELLSLEEFVRLVRKYVYPKTWSGSGGSGLAGVKDGRLVVKQSPAIHGALTDFLETLRVVQARNRTVPLQSVDFATARASLLRSNHTLPAVRSELDRKEAIGFKETPLEDALRYLQEATGLPIILDRQAIFAENLLLDVTVSLNVADERMSTILDRIVSRHGLDWYVEESGIVIITTQARVAALHEIHVYNVKHLLASGQTEQKLLDQITATIAPAGWSSARGTGVIRTLPGLLVVSHNRHVHAQVAAFITQRR